MAQLEVKRHNETQLSLMEEGDQVEFDRGLYSHWGIYIGNETVVHVTPRDGSGVRGVSSSSHGFNGGEKEKIVVKEDNYWKIAKNRKAFINNKKDSKMTPFSREQIVQNALSNRGKYDYNILSNNCEHFASQCRYGKSKSEQAKKAKIGIGSGTAGLILAALIAIVVAVVRVFLKKINDKSVQR